MSGDVADEIRELTRVVLWISDRCCKRAGLKRNGAPYPYKRESAVIPSAKELEAIRPAVVFTWTELEERFGQNVRRALAPLLRKPTEVLTPVFPNDEPYNGKLNMRPILELGDELVVLIPPSLLVALKHRAITRIDEEGLTSEVIARLKEFLGHDVNRSIGKMDWEELDNSFATAPKHFVERFYRFDADKIAHVLIACDELTNWNSDIPFGVMNDGEIQTELSSRVKQARQEIRYEHSDVQVLHLVVLAGLGRNFSIGFGDADIDENSRLLAFDCPDLETVARLEANDPMALWYYALAKDDLAKRDIRVLSWSAVDEFAMYWTKDHSFYMSDEGRPSFISIDSNAGLDLRMTAARNWDVHAKTSADLRSAIPFMRRYPDIDVPIYIGDPASGQLMFAVDGLSFELRVTRGQYPAGPGAAEWSYQFMEAVAYWMWQLTPWLNSLPMADHFIVVEVSLRDGSWNLGLLSELEHGDDWLDVHRSEEGLHVHIGPGIFAALNTSDNEGERRLVGAIVKAIDPTANATEVINVFAPLGPKKKLVVLSDERRPEVRTNGLPEPRYVQSTVVHRVLDQVGEHLSDEGITEGPIDKDQRGKVLAQCVEYAFGRIEALIAELDGHSLLDFLVAQNESVVAHEAEAALLTPTRLACFGDDEDYVETLRSTHRDRVLTSIATRFLIEYVGARPPSGANTVSMSVYDELVGLASEMISKGQLSDALFYGLADMELSFLGACRLGIERFDSFESAISQFLEGQIKRNVEGASSGFQSYWSAENNQQPDDDVADFIASVDVAMTAEFGYSLTELIQFSDAVERIYNGDYSAPRIADADEFVDKIAVDLEWEPPFVERILSTLTIEERPVFNIGADVFPWKFNRSMSYPRRPFIRRLSTDGHAQFVWGSRNFRTSGRYLSSLVEGGRLKAKSDEMQTLLGTIRSKEPKQYEKVVADSVQRPDLIVKRSIKKFGKLRIANGKKRRPW